MFENAPVGDVSSGVLYCVVRMYRDTDRTPATGGPFGLYAIGFAKSTT